MAIDEFWRNLRTAASLYSPTVAADSRSIDVPRIESSLRSADLWLTLRSIDGFEIGEFEFLDEDRRIALNESVQRFREVAGAVRADKPATPAQANEGRAAFEAILSILQPHRFHDAESFRTLVLLERELAGRLPNWVTALHCETGTDLAGDPGIWIRVDVTDAAVDKGKVVKQWQIVHDAVETAYARIGGRRWPFIRFRSPDAFAHRQGVPA